MSKFKDRTGEKRMMNCGLMAEIIQYRNAQDIDVRFEDGQETYHKGYGVFKNGAIAPPIDPRKIDRTGEKRMMNCGLEAEIIRYGNAIDIDVQFEDGQVVYHRIYYEFTKGKIAPPNYTRMIDRTGEKRMMNCGLEATIIRYGGFMDIDVRFENGQITEHKGYDAFCNGSIAPPNYVRKQNRSKINRIGEKQIMNCGLKATIIRYGVTRDIDVQFEDGQVVCHRRYEAFCKGEITHPGFRANKGNQSIYNYYITQYTERHPQTGEPYYHCKCQKCSFEIIDTARNIIKLEHKCETQPTEEGEN